MSDKKNDFDPNSSDENEERKHRKAVQRNSDGNSVDEPDPSDQPNDAKSLQKDNEKDKDKDKEKNEADSEFRMTSTSETPMSVKDKSSHFYVLQRDSVLVKRNCQLPRTSGVNVGARRKLIIASVLCLIFMIIEIIGGVLSNSLAIAADAGHMLSDFAAFMISLFAIWLAARNPTDRLSFGWHRAEVIGALASIMTIWSVTAVLVWLAIQRCINRDFEIDAIIMLATAGFAIITNIAIGIQLASGSAKTARSCLSGENMETVDQQYDHHGHSHGCDCKMCDKFGDKLEKFWRKLRRRKSHRTTITGKCQQYQENVNVRAAFLHIVGDGIQSVGVLISGIIIYVKPDWALADPICTFLFALLVLYTTVKILKDILLVLMEGTPTYVDYKEVQRIFENIEGVKSVHGLRIWALNIDKVALAVHLVIDRNVDAKLVLEKAEEVIHTHYHLYETTIQIEEDNGNDIV